MDKSFSHSFCFKISTQLKNKQAKEPQEHHHLQRNSEHHLPKLPFFAVILSSPSLSGVQESQGRALQYEGLDLNTLENDGTQISLKGFNP